MSARESMWSVFYKTAEGKAEGWGGRDQGLWAESEIRAIDYQTGKIRWTHPLGVGESSTGIMTTAGGVLFSGDNSANLLALDAETGKTLWHVSPGGQTENSPMTYELHGRQYVVFAVDDSLFAFALPEHNAR